VLTLGRVRATRVIPFLRASRSAEAAVARAAGKIWATGLARPPFVSTCSLWEDADSIAAYAFAPGAHATAMALDRARPFHHIEAFIRFRPYAVAGELGGNNPLRLDVDAQARSSNTTGI
jgi:spheroidene monooxygenase